MSENQITESSKSVIDVKGIKKEYDYLTEDPPINGQRYVCLSFLSPEGEHWINGEESKIKNCKIRGLKVRGVFSEYDEAKMFAEKLRDTVDNKFHIFVGEVGKWLHWDPSPDTSKEENYAEKELNSLMKAYNENQEKAKKLYEMRKDELVQKTLQEQEQRKADQDKKNKKNKKKKDKKKSKSVVPKAKEVIITDENQIKENEQEVKQTEDVIKTEQTSLKEDKDQLKETKEKMYKVESELEKLKREYEELTK